MENTGNFRKALLGFNRSDVMEYLAMLHNDYYAYRQESEKEIYDLRIKISDDCRDLKQSLLILNL